MTDQQPIREEAIIKGVAAAPGIATGPVYLYSKLIPEISARAIAPEEVPLEIERLRTANARAEKELRKVHAFAEQKLGSDSATIFEAQIMILGDTILMGTIERRITDELRNAEYIVSDEISKYKHLMLASTDEYMHERAHDVDDVMNRIIRNIQDQQLYSRLEGSSIIVTETLTPADTVVFSRNQVLGYATDLGGVTSHAALLSRSLKIPAVVGLRHASRMVKTGDTVAIDGYAGTLILNPSPATLATLTAKANRFKAFEEKLAGIAGLPAETLDHKRIELSSNIEFAEEIEFAKVQGSEGVGLFRTESQLVGRSDYPGEEEQAALYTQVADAAFPHPVIFRTFDVGGDKLAPDAHHEENPFLGWRGIRVLLDRPEILLSQLRAILRASARRNVRIMFPMVSSIEEVHRARAYVRQAKEELRAKGTRFDARIKVGVMIEVPAAAMMAEQIAAVSDFLSIGTNDLVQYMMAVDRGNGSVASLYQPFHPAVIRTLHHVIEAAHKKHSWVGVCGEMGGDPLATVLLVGLGVDELSVIPPILPEIKKIIRSIKLKDAQRVANKVLTMTREKDIRDYLSSIIKDKVPEIPLDD
ncbi:MAG TPA: phosphoenolpyruvate--protein phosphotransferase [Bacteroidota bacterium]|nr:phosphoenolpyruvate--protein phosphotransferase [Bacteroidota bacterium]